jgi:hypothetical protein
VEDAMNRLQPTLLDLSSFAGETMRVKTKELALRMARRDADVLRGCDVQVREFETTRRWKLPKPVIARVFEVRIEEADDYVDMWVKFHFHGQWHMGESGGGLYGRTYEINEKDGAS